MRLALARIEFHNSNLQALLFEMQIKFFLASLLLCFLVKSNDLLPISQQGQNAVFLHCYLINHLSRNQDNGLSVPAFNEFYRTHILA